MMQGVAGYTQRKALSNHHSGFSTQHSAPELLADSHETSWRKPFGMNPWQAIFNPPMQVAG